MLTLDWLLANTAPDAEVLVRARGPSLTATELREAVAAAPLPALDTEHPLVAVARSEPAAQLLDVLAAVARGWAVLPLDARAPADLRHATARRAGAALLLEDAGPVPLPGPRPLPPEIALVLPTSGSAGEPRLVALRASGLVANIEAILTYLPVHSHARVGVVLPFVSGYSLVGQALTTLRAGGTLLLAADLQWPSAQLDFFTVTEAQGLSSVPTSLRLLAEAALDRPVEERPPFGFLASAGAPLDPETLRRVRAAWPEARLFNQYGLTEASPRVTAISDADPAFDRGSVGGPLPGLELRVDAPAGETAEVLVRGPSLMAGYLDAPEATARALDADGWLHTGDLGRLDPEGRLFLVGRADDLVKVAGERVSLVAVAHALCEAPGVSEAFACAAPDPRTGRRLVAFVASDLPAEVLLPELRRFVRGRLPAASRPTRFVVAPALPRLPSGKVDRQALRARAEALPDEENP